jgi:hypothetical protein
MTDSPRTVTRARKLARKVVPLRIRKAFVSAVERITRQAWKAGTHHKVAPVSRLIADWDSEEAAEAAAWRARRP